MNTEELTSEHTVRWESNHQKIVAVISKNMDHHRKSPPTVAEIAEQTGLSRQTIYNHLYAYSTT